MNLRIGILGTRGIPNHYGGFEQFAEHLSVGLSQRGHHISVYNSHIHPYQKENYHNVQIIHCYDPEKLLGTAGQFIYDLNCILSSCLNFCTIYFPNLLAISPITTNFLSELP